MNRWIARAAAALLFAALIATHSAAQKSSEPDLYYYSGQMRVGVYLSQDELAVLPERGRRLPLQQLALFAPGGVVEETPAGGATIVFERAAADLAELKARAHAIASLGVRVAGVAYATTERDDSHQVEIIPNRFSLRLRPGDSIDDVTATFGLRVLQEVAYSERTYVVETESEELLAGVDAANALFESGIAEFATPLVLRQRQKRLIPNDTLFGNQWHLRNTGQVSGAVAGEDVNIVGAWDTYTGSGVNIAISDSGVQVAHQDLAPNARTDIDLDVNGGDDDPTPQSDTHGTNCAGIAAAKGNNAQGVAGAAFNAGIVGIRVIELASSDQDEADAMNHQVDETTPADYVHVNSNSWGPADCGCLLGTVGPLTKAALANGVTNGRGGKGTVYVWAGGNGRESADNVNYDAYASIRYTIAVGASGASGVVSYYSEPGASLLVNTPSSYTSAGTTTTTFPFGNPAVTNQYTNDFGGTSSAAPLAAGIIALMLEANPNLGWRDVQHVLVETAEKNDPGNGAWNANGTGRTHNVNYGFGRVDAAAAVTRAETWVPVPANATPEMASKAVNIAIPDNSTTGVTSTLTVSGAPADFFIEHVEITPSITHTYRGDLRIVLTSPSGRKSELANVHDDSGNNYSNWVFMSVAYWGENPNGNWSLAVKDLAAVDVGTFNSWTITFHGFLTDSSNTYVDPGYSGMEIGTPNLPYNSLAEGITNVSTGGTLHLKAATYTTNTISKALRIERDGGGIVQLQAP